MIEITVKRPNGTIEIIKKDGMSQCLFEKMKEATKKAGRGELLSWKVVDDRTNEEKAAHTMNDKIEKCEIELARARNNDPQAACKLRDELEALKSQKRSK